MRNITCFLYIFLFQGNLVEPSLSDALSDSGSSTVEYHSEIFRKENDRDNARYKKFKASKEAVSLEEEVKLTENFFDEMLEGFDAFSGKKVGTASIEEVAQQTEEFLDETLKGLRNFSGRVKSKNKKEEQSSEDSEELYKSEKGLSRDIRIFDHYYQKLDEPIKPVKKKDDTEVSPKYLGLKLIVLLVVAIYSGLSWFKCYKVHTTLG